MTAAKKAGCQPILVKTRKGLATLAAHLHEFVNLPVLADLCVAEDLILMPTQK